VKPVELFMRERNFRKEGSCSPRGGIFNTRHIKTLTPKRRLLKRQKFLVNDYCRCTDVKFMEIILPYVIYRFKFLILRQLEYICNEFH